METRPAFLTTPYSLLLDLLRVLSALAVLCGHGAQLLYRGYWPFDQRLQHYAVIAFFVLSGIVISASARKPGANLADYALARISRILPVALPAALFAAAVAVVCTHLTGDAMPGGIGLNLVAQVTFASGWPRAPEPLWNTPYWSLCYEVWFYALFGCALFLRGARRWLALALVGSLAGLAVLALLPAWLAGCAIERAGARKLPSPRASAWLLATGLAGFALVLACDRDLVLLAMPLPFDLGYSYRFIGDALAGLCLAVILLGARTIVGGDVPGNAAARALVRASVPIRRFAGFTFTLYLFHWPLLMAWSRLAEPVRNPAVFIMLLVAVLVLCAAIAQLTEAHSPRIRALLKHLMTGSAPPRCAYS